MGQKHYEIGMEMKMIIVEKVNNGEMDGNDNFGRDGLVIESWGNVSA